VEVLTKVGGLAADEYLVVLDDLVNAQDVVVVFVSVRKQVVSLLLGNVLVVGEEPLGNLDVLKEKSVDLIEFNLVRKAILKKTIVA
jgi:hypothetical protein